MNYKTAWLCTQCPLTHTVLYIARFNQAIEEKEKQKYINRFAGLNRPQIFVRNFNLTLPKILLLDLNLDILVPKSFPKKIINI